MKNFILILSLLIIQSLTFANTTVANVTALKGGADIEYQTKLKPAKIQDNLIKENTLITYKNGFAQVLFKDETIVSVGKDSKFSIEEYLGIETNEPKTQFNLLKGAMRVITGQIGKANPKLFKVKTQTSSIGIRGTNFIVISVPGQGDMVLCTQGAIYVTGKDGKEHYVEKGYMARLDKNGSVEGVKEFTSDDLNVVLNTVFKNDTSNNITTEGLISFFDYAFDDDPTNDKRETKKETKEEKKEGSVKAKVFLSKDEELETDNLKVIPIEDTVVLDENKGKKIQNTQATVNSTSKNAAQSDTQANEKITYIYGNGSTATIINDTTLISYYNRLGLSLALDPNNKAFSQDSIAVDSRSSTVFTFDSNLTTYVSPYNFSGTFTENTYTDGTSSYKVKSGSYIKTISDLDENDEVTWGEWLIPIDVTKNSNTNNEVWRGNFVAGKLTDKSVISSYAQANLKGTYSGSLIGKALEYENGSLLATDFNGTSVSNVDFGASKVDTTLTFSVKGTNYNETLNDTITDNKFKGTNSSGAFYGSDGKTLAGEFNLNDATNQRQLTGSFQGKTNVLSNQPLN